jgi:hypothetical protein
VLVGLYRRDPQWQRAVAGVAREFRGLVADADDHARADLQASLDAGGKQLAAVGELALQQRQSPVAEPLRRSRCSCPRTSTRVRSRLLR